MIFKRNTLVNFLYLLGITVIGAVVIFYKFPDIPPGLNFDEVEFAKLTFSLEDTSYIPYSPLATGHATLYFYILLLSFFLFGAGKFALRFPSALSGIINGLLIFEFFKRIFSKEKYVQYVAFLLAITMLTMRWYFNFARFSFEATFLLVFELSSLLFLVIYREKKNLLYLVGSGIMAGLAYNSYTPGRIFFLIPLLFLILDLYRKSKFKKQTFITLAYFVVPFIAVILPLTLYLSGNQDTRIYQQFFITNEQLTIAKRLEWVWQNIYNTFFMFFLKGDVNGIHNYPYKPALNPILAGFFFIGFVISLIKIKRFYNALFMLYFLFSVFPSIMTYPWENPNMLRTFTVIPAVLYFIGNAIFWILSKVKEKFTTHVLGLITCLLIASAGYELYTYFRFQTQVFPEVYIHGINFDEYSSK